jgi:hypothetical protein
MHGVSEGYIGNYIGDKLESGINKLGKRFNI